MHSDEKDSLTKLIMDVESAEEEGCCGYFGRKRCFSCAGCPAKDVDDPCDDIVYRDLARRLHALMPHDSKGVEIKPSDTIENRDGEQDLITDVLPFPAIIRDGGTEVTTFALPHLWRVVQPDSWEHLEADANLFPHDYLISKNASDNRYGAEAMAAMSADLVRRAKALAGVE